MMTNLSMTDLTDGHQPDRYKTVLRCPQREIVCNGNKPTLTPFRQRLCLCIKP